MSSASIEGLYATGHWLLASERYRDAALVFRAMTQLSSTDERGWLALGACHEGVGQLEIAIELYRVAFHVAEQPVRCHIACGRALRQLGMTDAADDAFRTAYDIARTSGDDGLAALAEVERAS